MSIEPGLMELASLLRELSPRQIVAWVDGIERYEQAGAPYGDTAADMIRWLEEQPGGFPDPDEAPRPSDSDGTP